MLLSVFFSVFGAARGCCCSLLLVLFVCVYFSYYYFDTLFFLVCLFLGVLLFRIPDQMLPSFAYFVFIILFYLSFAISAYGFILLLFETTCSTFIDKRRLIL